MTDDDRLERLLAAGRLLDQAIDAVDPCDQPLLSAHIAQAVHVLDGCVAELRREADHRDRAAAHRWPPRR